jgi:transcriptional regulator with XRE-family HTH domain
VVPSDLATARSLRALKGRAGVVVVDPLPAAKGLVTLVNLASAVLEGLGKSQQLTVLKRKPGPVALAWLCALGSMALPTEKEPRPLVLALEAQNLAVTEATEFSAWCETAGIDVCFVFAVGAEDPEGAQLESHALWCDLQSRRGVERVEWAELEAELGSRPNSPKIDPLAEPAGAGPAWRVPRADGVVFRSACRDLLSPAHFAEVDALFVARVNSFLEQFRALGPDPETRRLEPVIRTAIEVAPSTEELLVMVRAAQVAALRYGFHLAVDTPCLVAAAEVQPRRGLAVPQDWWRRLEAYQDPDPGALAALWVAGIRPGNAAVLRIDDVRVHELADGSRHVRVTSGGQEYAIDPQAAKFLIAQRFYRTLSATLDSAAVSGTEPLFCTYFGPGISAKTALNRLQEVDTELGIALIEDKVATNEPAAKTSLARYGLKLSKLLKAPPTIRDPEAAAGRRGRGTDAESVMSTRSTAGGVGAPRNARRRRRLVLDPARITVRRRALGLSSSALAAALGTSPGVILRLEAGASQDRLDLAFVADLARVLGCLVADLVVRSAEIPDVAFNATGVDDADADMLETDGGVADGESRQDPTDAQAVGSALAAAAGWVGVEDLCAHFGWSLERTLEALAAVEVSAPRVGLALAWLGDDVRLVPLVADPGTVAVSGARARRGLDRDGARLLYRLSRADGEKMIRRHPVMTRQRLVAMGLAKVGGPDHDTTLEISAEGRYNLCLDET